MVFMDVLERELYNGVGCLLHELAWSKNYPINPSIALNSFFEAFKDHGFALNLNDNFKIASFTFNYKGNSLSTSVTYDKILTGWGHQPKSSPASFYDSICFIYDNLNPLKFRWSPTKENIKLSNEWFYYRNSETKKVRQKMEDIWFPFFMNYQENMFPSPSGEIPSLVNPKIFDRVIKKFPMYVYRTAYQNYLFSEGPKCGPIEDYLLELDFTEDLNPEEYYPTKFTMEEFFFGHYLLEFSKEKSYPFVEKTKNELKALLINKEGFLESGERINWKFKPIGNFNN